MEHTTENAEETKKLGREFGDTLKGEEVIALSGEMGAGKTTFVQGLAESVSGLTRIISPTFILMREYPNKFGGNLYHIDLYRLGGNIERELANLGITDFLKDKKNIILVEWADKAKDYLPKNTKWVKFEHIDENTRRILI